MKKVSHFSKEIMLFLLQIYYLCRDYTGDFLCIFIHCNEAMKISKSLQWKQWKQWNWETNFFTNLGQIPDFFSKSDPSLGILLRFWCIVFSKVSNFKLKKLSKTEILESDPKLAWNLKNDTHGFLLLFFSVIFSQIFQFQAKNYEF